MMQFRYHLFIVYAAEKVNFSLTFKLWHVANIFSITIGHVMENERW